MDSIVYGITKSRTRLSDFHTSVAHAQAGGVRPFQSLRDKIPLPGCIQVSPETRIDLLVGNRSRYFLAGWVERPPEGLRVGWALGNPLCPWDHPPTLLLLIKTTSLSPPSQPVDHTHPPFTPQPKPGTF